MKSIKLIFALLLLSFSAVAQQNVSTDYANQINAAFAGINLNQVPHGLLKDYAMEFAELNDYDGNLTKENSNVIETIITKKNPFYSKK